MALQYQNSLHCACAHCGRSYDNPMSPRSYVDHMFHFPDQFVEVPPAWLDLTDQGRLGRTTELVNTADKFKLSLAVDGFKNEELDVRILKDHFLVIHGKHVEHRENECCTAAAPREFTRSFIIPRDVDWGMLKSNLGGDGTLTVEAPKKIGAEILHERAIPIEFSTD